MPPVSNFSLGVEGKALKYPKANCGQGHNREEDPARTFLILLIRCIIALCCKKRPSKAVVHPLEWWFSVVDWDCLLLLLVVERFESRNR